MSIFEALEDGVPLLFQSLCRLVVEVFDGLGAITAGILRSVGKQFTGALLNLSAYYVIGKSIARLPHAARSLNVLCVLGIPFGIRLAFWRGMHLHGLWIGLTVSLVFSAAIGIWISLSTNWDHEVEKVRRRLAADHKQANVPADAEAAR